MILYCQVVNRCFVWGAWGGVGDWGKTGNKMENCWGLDDLYQLETTNTQWSCHWYCFDSESVIASSCN